MYNQQQQPSESVTSVLNCTHQVVFRQLTWLSDELAGGAEQAREEHRRDDTCTQRTTTIYASHEHTTPMHRGTCSKNAHNTTHACTIVNIFLIWYRSEHGLMFDQHIISTTKRTTHSGRLVQQCSCMTCNWICSAVEFQPSMDTPRKREKGEESAHTASLPHHRRNSWQFHSRQEALVTGWEPKYPPISPGKQKRITLAKGSSQPKVNNLNNNCFAEPEKEDSRIPMGAKLRMLRNLSGA